MFLSGFSFQWVGAKALPALLTGLTVFIAATGFAQTPIQAREADRFVDSIGINVHVESPNLPYSNYPVINLKLRELGMRHFRDEINDTDDSFVDELRQIGGLGYTLCGLIEGGNDYPPLGTRLEADHLVPMIQSLLPTLDVVEGPNEPDNPSFVYDGTRYPYGAVNESEDLWHIVKESSDRNVSRLRVLAMSEGNADHFTKLANLVKLHRIPPPIDYSAYGNMHAYQGGEVGDAGLDSFIRLSQDWTSNEPLWTTEMGYHNYTHYLSNSEQQGVSERAAAIYLPIAFLSGFDRGILRTFSYELVDEINDPHLTHPCNTSESGLPYCSGEGHYGLVNFDGTPKPAFTTMRNLIALLRERGVEAFAPGSLTIAFSGAPTTMRYTLLQKSTGTFYLALWNDVSVYKLATPSESGRDRYPPSVPISVTFSEAKDLSVYAPNDPSGVYPTDAYTIAKTPDSISLDLPAQVLLIKIVGDRIQGEHPSSTTLAKPTTLGVDPSASAPFQDFPSLARKLP